MMIELGDMQNSYQPGTSPFKWINNCLYELDGAASAIAKLEE